MNETTAPPNTQDDSPADAPARSPVAGPTLAERAATVRGESEESAPDAQPEDPLPELTPLPLPPTGH